MTANGQKKRVPVKPHGDKPLGGTHNIAAVQGKDNTWEFPNTNPCTVTLQSSVTFLGTGDNTTVCKTLLGARQGAKIIRNQRYGEYTIRKCLEYCTCVENVQQ